jgi:predicted dehydrogenase
MEKIRIGVLCPSEIAIRRFMPAITKIDRATYVGVAHADEEEWFGSISPEHNLSILDGDKKKAINFESQYKGKVFDSFKSLITSDEVDAVYIPLPPALHFKWAKFALENGKHVLVEKPATDSLNNTKELIEIAKNKNLAITDNYMFIFHSQIEWIANFIREGTLGDIRLIRISFGFPFRGTSDFRYSKKLGGGALLDCGGYTIKLARFLLGDSAKLVAHQLNYVKGYDVDMFGSGTLVNDNGLVTQLSFGMDNSYKCDLEVWGSKGNLFTGRVFTAPVGFNPTIQISSENGVLTKTLPSDDSFGKSINFFIDCINDVEKRKNAYNELESQASFVEKFKEN